MMRRLIGMLVPLGLLAPVASPALARDAAVEAPIHRFADSFNRGDVAGAARMLAEKVAITDEIAPFHWHGKAAFADWGKDYDSDAVAKGITAPTVEIAAATRTIVQGDHAYVIVPATYRFTQKGVKMAEVAQMTFGLDKIGTEWKISAWTWTGPDATPAP